MALLCANDFTPALQTCGDSQCEGKYSFIGKGTGIGRKKEGKEGKKITYAEAWKGFERCALHSLWRVELNIAVISSLTSARIPCTSIARYPVVARWRADVDYVAAGIFCFQVRWSPLSRVGSFVSLCPRYFFCWIRHARDTMHSRTA